MGISRLWAYAAAMVAIGQLSVATVPAQITPIKSADHEARQMPTKGGDQRQSQAPQQQQSPIRRREASSSDWLYGSGRRSCNHPLHRKPIRKKGKR